ncbi:MAG: hypothetical protein MJ192_06980 [Clostridia bacterium]|nr:hypothetical protein [Clostridia bacterium]
MKRLLPALLVLCLLLSLTLTGCGRAPSGFVGKREVVYDNDTPFVYDADYKTYVEKPRLGEHPEYAFNEDPLHTPGLAADSVSAYRLHFDGTGMTDENLVWLKNRYLDFTADFGAKVIRTSTDKDGEAVLYSVWCEEDNQLSYVFLGKTADGALYVRDTFPLADVTTDERSLRDMGVLDKDLPTALLGDALPSRYLAENVDPARLIRRTESECLIYAELCASLGLPPVNAARLSDPTVRDTYRCLVSCSFGVMVRDSAPPIDLPALTDSCEDAVVSYDLVVYEDGTGALTVGIYQWNRREYPQYTLVEGTARTASIPADEITAFESLLTEYDFDNIPTSNPAEQPGLDGSTTYFSDGRHLIAHWEPSPYFGIRHFRAALERMGAEYGTAAEK